MNLTTHIIYILRWLPRGGVVRDAQWNEHTTLEWRDAAQPTDSENEPTELVRNERKASRASFNPSSFHYKR